jgi:predicted nucleic acid-binding protein
MRLYLDTSVFSAYYDERSPERMELTSEFWTRLSEHERLCSELTIEELNRARLELKQKLLALTQNFEILKISKQMKGLAKRYVEEEVVPPRYFADAIHIAAAVTGKADILVTWNYRHLVKRRTRLLVNYLNDKFGLRSIEILAPPEV